MSVTPVMYLLQGALALSIAHRALIVQSFLSVQASAAAASAVSEDPAISEASAAVPGAVADASAEVAALDRSNGSGDGDVYVADDAPGPGVWEVDNVLDAEYDPRSQLTAYESRTLSLEVTLELMLPQYRKIEGNICPAALTGFAV